MNNVKKSIGWADYTINPVKGLCPVACDYCYARRMYKRFKWNPEIRFEQTTFASLELIKTPSRIFIGSTIELFGDWVKPEWMKAIFQAIRYFPQHTFIFLTKRPESLAKWSPFPDNCWIGVSSTTNQQYCEALFGLAHIQSKVKFLSLEPLLENIKVLIFDSFINWVIVGQQTPASAKTALKMSWIQEILVAASNIPIFMKDNLQPLLVGEWAGWKLRQEFPDLRKEVNREA